MTRKYKKRSNHKKLKDALDSMCSLIVRSEGRCIRCNKQSTLQPHHIYSRNNLSVRWDLNNLLCVCAGCHFFAHQNPMEFSSFVWSLKGNEGVAALMQKANSIKKWTDHDLELLLNELTAKYEEISKIRLN